MNFHLSAVDDLLRRPQDGPSIGLILCKGEGRVMVEYALRDVGKPIGVSAFKLAESLPESFRGSLPTIEDLEAELSEGGPAPHEEPPPESSRPSLKNKQRREP